jgi:hypothetical protein
MACAAFLAPTTSSKLAATCLPRLRRTHSPVSDVPTRVLPKTNQWLEPVHRQEFGLKVDSAADGTVLEGSIAVYNNLFLIGEVPLSIAVALDAPQSQPSVRTPGTRCRKIFASYSHSDVEIMESVADYVALTGDTYLSDLVDLRSGEDWDERLLEMINEADIFQLFWSTSSMRSPHVRREWEHALQLRRKSFVRPVYWGDPLPEDRANGLRALRPDRQSRTHRPHPDLRRTASAKRPHAVRRPLQRPTAASSTPASSTTPRSSRSASRPTARRTPIGPRRPDQRVRARSLKPQVSAHSQVLEPCSVCDALASVPVGGLRDELPVGAENPDTASDQRSHRQPTDLALTGEKPAQHDLALWRSDSRT